MNNGIYCCHAGPDSDTGYLLENLKSDHIEIKEYPEIDKILKDIEQEIADLSI